MNKSVKVWRIKDRENAEEGGNALLLFGALLMIICVILAFIPNYNELWLVGISIGVISIALGFIAIGMSSKSDKRHSELLERLDKNIGYLPIMLKDDILTPSGQLFAQGLRDTLDKEAAQKRLDEDNKRVGYLRGKLYQTEEGKWAIHWGGEFPL